MQQPIKMKKNIFLLTISLIFIILNLHGQIHIYSDTLIKTTYKKSDKDFVTNFTDIKYKPENFLIPAKDSNGNIPNWMTQELNSIEKLNQISQKVFTPGQIQYLRDKRFYVSCIVSSSGKIISVSFNFYNNDPNVPLKQLVEYSKQIKENMTFSFTFDREITEEGFYLYGFPAFKTLFNKNLKY
jgi:hypothetical protein